MFALSASCIKDDFNLIDAQVVELYLDQLVQVTVGPLSRSQAFWVRSRTSKGAPFMYDNLSSV